MPIVYLEVRWPDHQTGKIYSPSSVIREFFKTGEQLKVSDFEPRIHSALQSASSRVAEVYGYECTSAMAERVRISKLIKAFDPGDTIEILGLT